MDPYINVTERVGDGSLATTFSDPTDLPIIFRKWILGDGTVVEGNGYQTINHNYLNYGEYDVTLVARTTTKQYSITRENLIAVNEFRPNPQFILSQSFNQVTGQYWRFYFDYNFYLIFENNEYIIKSIEKVANIKTWTFLEFNMHTNKMYVGTFSKNRKEISTLRAPNLNPILSSRVSTQILPYGNIKIDELKIWNRSESLYSYYDSTRGRAGYLDNL